MRVKKVSTYLNDDNMPYLVQETTPYSVDGRKKHTDPEMIYQLLRQIHMTDRATEMVMLLMFDTSCHLICINEVSTGTVDRSYFGAREIAQTMLLCGAKSCVVAHNHPSGCVAPSDLDIETTKQLMKALNLLQLSVLDHLIIGKYGYISLYEQKYL